MTAAEQLAHDQWFGSLVMSVLVGVVVPLLVFFALCFVAWWLLSKAQAGDNKFEIADLFLDEATGKTSMTQMLKLGGWIFHTILSIIAISVNPSTIVEVTTSYGAIWGTAGAGLEFIKRRWPTEKPP